MLGIIKRAGIREGSSYSSRLRRGHVHWCTLAHADMLAKAYVAIILQMSMYEPKLV